MEDYKICFVSLAINEGVHWCIYILFLVEYCLKFKHELFRSGGDTRHRGGDGYFGGQVAQHILDIIDINEQNMQYVEAEFSP